MGNILKTPIGPEGYGWVAIGQEEILAVSDLLKTPEKLFRYSEDADTQSSLLESELTSKLGVKHALFVNSGTSALTCCLIGWGVGPGDEVIIPGYTYISTAAAVVNAGAVPIIAEIDESLGIDPEDVRKKITPYTKAIMPVHMQGIPAKMDAIWKIADEHKLIVIEDCCQAIGSKYKGEYTGLRSHAFAWSLNYYKILTCGEGGVFFTNDDSAFLRGVYLSDPGTPMWESELKGDMHVPVFSKACYRASEINATIMRVQLQKLDCILEHTRGLKKLLLSKLKESDNYSIQHVDDPSGDCGISFAMIFKNEELLQKFADKVSDEGLEIGSLYSKKFPDRHIYSYWDSILNKRGTNHLNYPWGDPNYKGCAEYSKDMCPRTLDILSRTLRMSIHLNMTKDNIQEIAELINKTDEEI